jgi:hypothetical protein
MELRGLLQPERLPLFAVAASDVTERFVGRKRLRIERVLRILRTWKWRLCFPRFHFSAIFWR